MNFSKPLHVMEYRDNNGVRDFIISYNIVDQILLQPSVKDRKVVILSVIGEYRKGKSFFLGYCLRFLYANYTCTSQMSKPSRESAQNWMGKSDEPLSGFSWRHGHVPDTKGILFWPDVFLYDSADDKIAIILMDTQGLFEIGSTQDENARIFGLSILSSSIQIINLKDVIQENQIEYLDMATNFTKCVGLKTKKGKWKSFQKLLFLIRDWQNEDIEGGLGYDGGETYLQGFLKVNGEARTKSEKIRVNINDSFDSIKCFLLNHPGSKVSKKVFNGEWGKLDDDFIEHLKSLVESLLLPQNLLKCKKSIFGKDVTSSEYRDYIHAYLKAFRDAKLPDIENIFLMTINNQLKAIVDKQLHAYQNTMNEELDFTQENFENFIDNKHKQAKANAKQKFLSSEKIEDEASIEKYKKILKAEIEKSYELWKRSTMRDYHQFIAFKKQIDQLNLEKEEQKKLMGKMEENFQNQALENAKIQQELEEKQKKHQEQAENLKAQVDQLHITNNEKEMKMKEIQEKMNESKLENERKINQLKEEQALKLSEALQNYREEARQEQERIKQLYENQLHKLEESSKKDKEETERKLKEYEEKMKTETLEQKRESEKARKKLQKEYEEREAKRDAEKAKSLEEMRAQIDKSKNNEFPVESFLNLFAAGFNAIAKVAEME